MALAQKASRMDDIDDLLTDRPSDRFDHHMERLEGRDRMKTMTATAREADDMHGECAFCNAPLCFGPYMCCMMMGQRQRGSAVVPGRRQNGIETCFHSQCKLLSQKSEELHLAALVTQVAAQLLAVPLPCDRTDAAVREWALTRASNIIAGLQPDLRITPLGSTKVRGHSKTCQCKDCRP